MTDDPILLKKQARKRLIGAIAFALIIAFVLPVIFDKEPKLVSQDVNIQVPRQSDTSLASKAVPIRNNANVAEIKAPSEPQGAKNPESKPQETKPKEASLQEVKPSEPKPVQTKQEELKPTQQQVAAAPPPASTAAQKKSEKALVDAILSGKETYVVQLGVFSKDENAKHLLSRLTAEGIKSYSELVELNQKPFTRVRAGPYASKEEAEKAQGKLKRLGLKGQVTVASK